LKNKEDEENKEEEKKNHLKDFEMNRAAYASKD
jgi:hypothetical protein